jgi:hypothetical protein
MSRSPDTKALNFQPWKESALIPIPGLYENKIN